MAQDNWNTIDPAFVPLWMDGHILAAKQLKKPLVLEAFAKARSLGRMSGVQSVCQPAVMI